MAVSQAQIQEWLRANPGATDTQIAQAMQQFGVGTAQMAQATGVGLDEITRRYNIGLGLPEGNNRRAAAMTAPAGTAPQQNYAGLSATSGANEVSNAYKKYLAEIGSKDTDATRVTARDYLMNLGMGAGDIDTAYQHYRTNNPSIGTAPASTFNPVTTTFADPTKYDQQNPYLQQMGDSITSQVTDNLNRNIMPGIRSSAVSSGNFGGSRQGVVEANAIKDANQGISNSLTQMRFGDYNNTMGRQLQRYGQDQSYNLGLGNLDLQNRNSSQNFYSQQRGQDLQQVGLGASLFGQGNQGMLNQGQGIYNLGLTGQQAPWQSMQNFGNVSQPYTGFGSSSQNQSGSAGAGFLGGALAGSQAYNIFGGNSGPMGVQNTGGFTNTPNYLRF